MRLRSLLWNTSDFFWLKILGGRHLKEQYKERCRRICETVISFFDEDEPFVIDGKWSWYKSDNVHYPITILFTEQPLAIQVSGPEIGPWEQCRKYCRNRKSWEIANQSSNYLRSITRKIGLPLLVIDWNEPIDPTSMLVKLTEFTEIEKD